MTTSFEQTLIQLFLFPILKRTYSVVYIRTSERTIPYSVVSVKAGTVEPVRHIIHTLLENSISVTGIIKSAVY